LPPPSSSAPWFGFVFATALSPVGFGCYAVDAVALVGVAVGEAWVIPVALLFGAGFTVLTVEGTVNAAKPQNGVFALFLSILVVFPGFGVLDAMGVVEQPSAPENFAPEGYSPTRPTDSVPPGSTSGPNWSPRTAPSRRSSRPSPATTPS
jgi:amino acid transporter